MNQSVSAILLDLSPVRLASSVSGCQRDWKEGIQTEGTECAKAQSHEIIWSIVGTTSLEN